jgi:hypothetical protein
MSLTMIIKALVPGTLIALSLSVSASALGANSLTINDTFIAGPTPAVQPEATLKAVRAFYGFWNTGDVDLLKQAITESFTDHSLRAGRPQGPEGPAFASRQFRAGCRTSE